MPPPVFSDNPDECTPLNIGRGDSTSGSRVGGRPPLGISPRLVATARYFATIGISNDPVQEISLFFPLNGDVVAARSGQIHRDGIEVVVHGESRRDLHALATPLPEHPLIVQARTSDWITDEEGEASIRAGHKVGGRPLLLHNEAAIEKALADLDANGYRHVLQFDFPVGGDDALFDGPWPFGDGMFHLFGRCTEGLWEWQWFWDL